MLSPTRWWHSVTVSGLKPGEANTLTDFTGCTSFLKLKCLASQKDTPTTAKSYSRISSKFKKKLSKNWVLSTEFLTWQQKSSEQLLTASTILKPGCRPRKLLARYAVLLIVPLTKVDGWTLTILTRPIKRNLSIRSTELLSLYPGSCLRFLKLTGTRKKE